MTIQETAAAAKAAGMSYGEYVNETEGKTVEVKVPPGLTFTQEAELKAAEARAAGKPQEPQPDETVPVHSDLTRTCPKCGKLFLVESRISRKKYCSVGCQQAAAADRQKAKYQEKALARLEAEEEQDEAPPKPPVRETILAKAEEIYQGNRAGQYGQRERNFESISALWSAYLGRDVSPADVAAMMALLKIARMGSGHYKEDNVVDAVNYLLFAAELGEA